MAELAKYFYFRVKSDVKSDGLNIQLEDASDADVVEVVRCRECVNWDDTLVHDDYHYCYMHDHYTVGDFYCANGERKECMTNL